MLVSIVLIGGNHDWGLGGRAGKMQTGSGGFPGGSETCWRQRHWISAEGGALDGRAGGKRPITLRLSLLLA